MGGPDGRPRAWVVAHHDLSAEQAVSRSEERLRLATEDARVAVWEFDYSTGRMSRTENHDALYGLPRQAVWTSDVFVGAVHPDDLPATNQAIKACLAPGGPDHYAFDYRVVWPDGSTHWLTVTGHVVARDARGAGRLVRGGLVDVTRLKTVEAELRQAVHAREEFLHVASHELNTPLAGLVLRLEAAARAARGDPGPRAAETRTHLEGLRHQVGRLARLVTDLLDVGGLARGQLHLTRADLDLAQLAGEVAEQLAPEAQRAQVELALALPAAAPVRGDRARLEQVVANLLSNALKYGAGKPVRGARVSADGRRRLGARPGHRHRRRGAARIFEQFERAVSARHYGGLGLGLYIARADRRGPRRPGRGPERPGPGRHLHHPPAAGALTASAT